MIDDAPAQSPIATAAQVTADAKALWRDGRHGEAARLFAQAAALAPTAAAHCNLANALAALGQDGPAALHYRAALDLAPDNAQVHANHGRALLRQGRGAEAARALAEADRLAPGAPAVHNDLAVAHLLMNQPAPAIAWCDAVLAVDPGHANARYNRGLARLKAGDFGGWADHEARWGTTVLAPTARAWPVPLWTGEPIAGRTVLLHAEQGFGDTLQFCRYASLVAARGARVLMEVPGPLVTLLGSLTGPAAVIASGAPLRDPGAPLPAFDLHCPLMSLPWACGTTLDTIPAPVPYLAPDPQRAAAWAERLAPLPRPRVGLVWAGAGRPHDPLAAATDRRRSLPPEALGPLLDVPGIAWASLQKDATPADPRILDLSRDLTDFAETAAVIANLDRVIGVDTAVIHLAGAMGKPVWVLSRYDACWRWMLDRDDSPWYPTLRLFRQPAPGDWAPAIIAAAAALRHG